MLSGTKIQIFPTDEQREKLTQSFGCARFVYNRALAIKSTAYEERGESISCYSIKSMLPQWKQDPETAWLADTHSQVLQQSVLNLDTAFKNFFQNVKDRKAGKTKRRVGYPRFKKRSSGWQSIQYPQGVKVNEAARQLFLPKVGWIDALVHRDIVGVIKTVTIKRTPTGKYTASILAEDGTVQPEPIRALSESKVTAIDVGLARFATTSESEVVENPRHINKASANLRRKQKALSRKDKGSANRTKAKHHVAIAHERVANARADFHHQLSSRLVRQSHAIVVEDLAVSNMLKNHCLAKAISDVGWSQFGKFVGYKLERQGGHFVKVDRWFPSSKTCHVCHTKIDKLPLNVRSWDCPDCGTTHDRDVNAALNLKHQGILQLKAEGLTVSVCGRLRKTPNVGQRRSKQETSLATAEAPPFQGGE